MQIQKLFSKLPRLQEFLLTYLLGNIPTGVIGGNLRNLLYKRIFNRFGNSVKIQPGVEFLGTSCIELGTWVQLSPGVRLNASGHSNNRLVLGNHVVLEQGVDIRGLNNSYVHIDDGTFIGLHACISGSGNIKIGKNCLIASNCAIYASNHNYDDPTQLIKNQGGTRRGVVIEDDCWLGNRVTVLDGVTIGEGSVIGAGAVVTKDIPPYSVAVGVPAKVIKSRKENRAKVFAHN